MPATTDCVAYELNLCVAGGSGAILTALKATVRSSSCVHPQASSASSGTPLSMCRSPPIATPQVPLRARTACCAQVCARFAGGTCVGRDCVRACVRARVGSDLCDRSHQGGRRIGAATRALAFARRSKLREHRLHNRMRFGMMPTMAAIAVLFKLGRACVQPLLVVGNKTDLLQLRKVTERCT